MDAERNMEKEFAAAIATPLPPSDDDDLEYMFGLKSINEFVISTSIAKRLAMEFSASRMPTKVVARTMKNSAFRDYLKQDLKNLGLTKQNLENLRIQVSNAKWNNNPFSRSNVAGCIYVKFDHVWSFVCADNKHVVLYQSEQNPNVFSIWRIFDNHEKFNLFLRHFEQLWGNTPTARASYMQYYTGKVTVVNTSD